MVGLASIDLRRYERVAFYCRLQLTVLPNGPVGPGNSFDISIGGVGITTALLLECGQQVSIRFYLHNGRSEEVHADVLGQVAYCQSDENGNRVGVEFLAPIQNATQPVLAKKINSL
jgi:hypothetical protein